MSVATRQMPRTPQSVPNGRARGSGGTATRRPQSLKDELGKSGPFTSLEQEAWINLVRTTSMLSADFERLFQSVGLSMPLYNTLRIIAGHGEKGVPSQTIGKHLISRGPDVTRLVDRLLKLGFVERKPCRADRRVVYVRLLPAGQKLLTQLRDAVDALHVQQLGHLSEDKLRRLSKLLFEARNAPESAEASE
jgi:DNA-binding MarR family transcriptional regulator